jgi:hypothetical protein
LKYPQQTHINKLLPLPLLLSPPRLVLKHHIVVPPPLDVEIRLVQQRVPQRNVALALLLLGRLPLALLALPLLGPLAPHPLQLALQLGFLVVVGRVRVVIRAVVVVGAGCGAVRVRVGVDVAGLGEDAPPFGFGVFVLVWGVAVGGEGEGALVVCGG